jgi:trk system potassium uptake protein TrkA
MLVIIVSAGQVGQTIAEMLLKMDHDVIVVDHSKEALEALENRLDVQTILGAGTDPAVLKKANIGRADVFMALTRDEEANLLSALAARQLGAKRTVARVRSSHYLKPDGFDYRKALDIDLVISPEVMTAAQVVKYLDNPDALALEFYAQGKVQLIQFEIEERHAYAGKPVREIKLPGGVLVVLVTRGTEVLIPTGETALVAGDKITMLGRSGTLNSLREGLGKQAGSKFGTVVIAGGGQIGALVAEALEGKNRNVKLLEMNLERCRELAAHLEKTTILHGDATTRSFLSEERVGKADVFVAAMHSDEDNIMSALLARNLGAAKLIAIVKRPDYTPLLVEGTQIDLALSPREVTAARVLAMLSGGRIRNVSLLEEGRAEVIELRAREGSALVGRPLKELTFPPGSLVGMISRGNTVRIPRGDDKILAGDTVIMVTLAAVAREVEEMF